MNYPPPSQGTPAYRPVPIPQPPTVAAAPIPESAAKQAGQAPQYYPPAQQAFPYAQPGTVNPVPRSSRVQQPSPAPERHRRAERTAQRGKGRRRKKKSSWSLTGWEGLIVFLLLCAVALGALQLGQAGARLRQLRAERQLALEQYEQTVRDHQVRYRDLIEKYAAEYDLNPAFVSAIIKQESSFDPRAVSRKGAMGLMQFMPDTFSWVAPNCGISKSDVDAVYEPENAIKMGCYLLRYIIRQLGSDDPVLVACAYHAGWGTVPSWLKDYSTDGQTLQVSQIPKSDTRTYAGRVLNSYAIYLQHYY